MKKLFFKHISTILTGLLVMLMSIVSAQKTNKKLLVVIDVVIDNYVSGENDSLVFEMSKDNINSDYEHSTNLCQFKLTAAKTRLVIPLSTSLNYGRVSCVDSKSHEFAALDNSNNLFIFQGGDTIAMHLSNKKYGAYFGGKNAVKYNCTYRLNNNDNTISFNTFNMYAKRNDWNAAYHSLLVMRDSVFKTRIDTLDIYKNKLSSEVYNLIKLDCWALCNQRAVGFCYNPFFVNAFKQYPAARELFDRYYSNYKESLFSDLSLLVKSHRYSDFLNVKENAYVIINNSTVQENYFSKLKFADIHDAINSHYQPGILKDKMNLLAYLNFNRSRQADFVNYINKDIDEAGDNQFKTALQDFKKSMTVGSDAFPFQMPDAGGRMYTNKDFKGKLVVFDFWFTGCKGCTMMAACLKPIISSYKNNPNVVFVSVSIDREKSLWLKSLKEEKYSSKDEINLSEGMTGGSPFVKYYNIDGYPTLIVVSKEGKVISAAPPDPRMNVKVFTDFLNRNL